jgi:hypothetical protein
MMNIIFNSVVVNVFHTRKNRDIRGKSKELRNIVEKIIGTSHTREGKT